MSTYATISDLIGKTLIKIDRSVGDEELRFICDDGTTYLMYHDQMCCESVTIEDICGDLNDLIGVPVLVAEESTSDENPPDRQDQQMEDFLGAFGWTFYHLRTQKGTVTIRWYGESNGYYAVGVDFIRLDGAK